MGYRLDEVDRRVLYRLMADARRTSAPDIAEEVNVSPGTVRNRIRQLEDAGVITGYHAGVDFERADRRLTNLFICTAAVPDRSKLAAEVRHVPGVVDVRELMAGRRNVHVTAVGSDMADLGRISRAVSTLGLDIEGESLIRREYREPYDPFGPEDGFRTRTLTDFISLAGDADVAELTVREGSAVAERTLREANESGLVDAETLVIAIERDGAVVTPRGDTVLRPGDLVTVFTGEGLADELVERFAGEA